MSKKVLLQLLITYWVVFGVVFVVFASIYSILETGRFALFTVRPPAVFIYISLLFVLVGLPPTFAFLICYAREIQVRLKEMEKERTEGISKEHLGKKVLGCLRVRRRVRSILRFSIIHEILVITPNRVFVEGIRTETPDASSPAATGTIDFSHHKFAIPESEIKKIELNKLLQVTLKIITREKEYKWWVQGLIPEKKGVKLEDYKNILRLAFPDKLSVKK